MNFLTPEQRQDIKNTVEARRFSDVQKEETIGVTWGELLALIDELEEKDRRIAAAIEAQDKGMIWLIRSKLRGEK